MKNNESKKVYIYFKYERNFDMEKFNKEVEISKFPESKIEEVAEEYRVKLAEELSLELLTLLTQVCKLNISIEKIKKSYLEKLTWLKYETSISIYFKRKKYGYKTSNLLLSKFPRESLQKYVNRVRKQMAKEDNISLSELEWVSTDSF